MFAIFESGTHWPPQEEKMRLARYAENKQLYDGRLEDVFFRLQAYYWQRNNTIARGYLPGIDINASKKNIELTYISVRLVSLLVKKPTDLLFGEDSVFSSGKEPNSPEQKALERLVEENDFHTTLMELGLGTAYRGDGIFKVRMDPTLPHPTVIEAQDAAYWVPETYPGDRRRIKAHHLAVVIVVQADKEKRYFLRVESHMAGKIHNRLFRLGRPSIDEYGQPDYLIESEIDDITTLFPELERVVDTGVPYPLVIHIPNQRTDADLYGSDDVDELKPLLDELANRLTQISMILDKHADPIIALPSGSMTTIEDPNTHEVRYVYRAHDNKAIEVDSKEDIIPQYVVWDGQLEAAFKEMERVLDLIFMIAEVPRLIVGGTGESGGGTSGAAALNTKYRLLPLLAKVNRKKRYLDKGIRQALYVAQLLEKVYAKQYGAKAIPDYIDYEPTYPKIIWADGLPKDELTEATIMQIRTGAEATIDQVEAIMRLDGKTEDQAKQTMDRIKQHQADMATIDNAAKADAAVNAAQGGAPSAKDRHPLG